MWSHKDPPPSYESVVGESGELQTKPSDSQQYPKPTTTSSKEPESNGQLGQDLECNPTGFWARVKKRLEDLALFFIQILD